MKFRSKCVEKSPPAENDFQRACRELIVPLLNQLALLCLNYRYQWSTTVFAVIDVIFYTYRVSSLKIPISNLDFKLLPTQYVYFSIRYVQVHVVDAR